MADLNFENLQSRVRELKHVGGSILPNGTSALASSKPTKGAGFTAARSAIGKYILTLEATYPSLVSSSAKLRMGSAHNYEVTIGAVDVVTAKTIELYIESTESLQWVKTAVDGAAGTTTAETIVGRAAGAMPIGHLLYLTPQAALTADDTNFATITISKRTAGAAKTTVATVLTKITGGTGNWVAFTAIAVPLTVAVAAGDTLQVEIAKTGTGVAVQPFVLQAAGLQDIPAAAANVLEVALLLQNSSVTP